VLFRAWMQSLAEPQPAVAVPVESTPDDMPESTSEAPVSPTAITP
jgi:hypothetical protein